MFDKEKDDTPSIISSDMKVVGSLKSGGDIQIEGSVEGDVESRTVTISEKAHINGSVNAETVNILGRINGKIIAAVVRIAKAANVQGEINYQTLSIEDGAVIDGQIRRKERGIKSDAAKKPATGDSAASIKPSVAGMKPSGGKPLAD